MSRGRPAHCPPVSTLLCLCILLSIEPLVSTLTEQLMGTIGEHDEALAAAPIWSYTKPPAPGKLLECLGAASTKSTATQTKPVELLTMGEAQDRLADLRVEEKALEQRIEHLTQNATPIDIQQGFLQHLYEVVWRGAVPEEYGRILASMVSTMVPDTTDDSFDGTNSVLSDCSISCLTSSPPSLPPLDSFVEQLGSMSTSGPPLSNSSTNMVGFTLAWPTSLDFGGGASSAHHVPTTSDGQSAPSCNRN